MRTEGYDDANSRFSQFCERAWKDHKSTILISSKKKNNCTAVLTPNSNRPGERTHCLQYKMHLERILADPQNRKSYRPTYTGCNRRNVRDFGREFLRSNYTDITQNTYIQSWTVTEIMAGEFWNFDSCYSLIYYQIHIETGRNMWFLDVLISVLNIKVTCE